MSSGPNIPLKDTPPSDLLLAPTLKVLTPPSIATWHLETSKIQTISSNNQVYFFLRSQCPYSNNNKHFDLTGSYNVIESEMLLIITLTQK
jgi:hypothetical protein